MNRFRWLACAWLLGSVVVLSAQTEQTPTAPALNPPAIVWVPMGAFNGKFLHGDPPKYPEGTHVAGTVALTIVVDTTGKVEKAVAQSGPIELRQAAIDAVQTWVYQPYLIDGIPAHVKALIHVGLSPERPPTVPLTAEQIATMPRGPARISGGVISGTKLSGDDPKYPPRAKAAHVQGLVVLHAIIGKDGKIKDVTVVSGPDLLQNAAIEAVRTWTYRPYLLAGEPTEVDTTLSVSFSINR